MKEGTMYNGAAEIFMQKNLFLEFSKYRLNFELQRPELSVSDKDFFFCLEKMQLCLLYIKNWDPPLMIFKVIYRDTDES